MKIKNSDNSDFFELIISGYQFADESKIDIGDLEWLYVTTRASLSGKTWESTEPSLMFREAKRLAVWFEKIGFGDAVYMEEYFVEPNISFELGQKLRDKSTIRVHFELESRPPWNPSVCVGDEKKVYIDITVDNHELIEASESILADLRLLPPRTGNYHP